jgi:hypothetical protein
MTSRMLLAVVAFAVSGCGVKLGTPYFNDPVPEGTLLAHGTLNDQPGNNLTGTPVSGSAQIFSTTSGYVARLNGVSTPSEAALQVRVENGGAVVATLSLRGTSGNQNYPFIPSSATGSWNAVAIHSSIRNMDYGRANLVAP